MEIKSLTILLYLFFSPTRAQEAEVCISLNRQCSSKSDCCHGLSCLPDNKGYSHCKDAIKKNNINRDYFLELQKVGENKIKMDELANFMDRKTNADEFRRGERINTMKDFLKNNRINSMYAYSEKHDKKLDYIFNKGIKKKYRIKRDEIVVGERYKMPKGKKFPFDTPSPYSGFNEKTTSKPKKTQESHDSDEYEEESYREADSDDDYDYEDSDGYSMADSNVYSDSDDVDDKNAAQRKKRKMTVKKRRKVQRQHQNKKWKGKKKKRKKGKGKKGKKRKKN